jgi:ethanolamine-phosphate phospho-lyase
MEALAILEDEQLQAHALDVGTYTQRALRDTLLPNHECVGDIRGTDGLIFGIELVEERTTRAPDAACAEHVMTHCRTHAGVLVSTDGPHRNVIKVKPPMCFTHEDGDTLVAAIDHALDDYEWMYS